MFFFTLDSTLPDSPACLPGLIVEWGSSMARMSPPSFAAKIDSGGTSPHGDSIRQCEAGELRSNKNCQVPGTQPSGAWRWAQLASLERWLPSWFDRGNLFCQAWISEAAQWSLCYRVQCQQLLWRWRVRIPSAIDAVYEWNFHNLSRLSLLRNFGAVIVLSAANFPRYEVFELCPQNFLWGAVAIQKGNQCGRLPWDWDAPGCCQCCLNWEYQKTELGVFALRHFAAPLEELPAIVAQGGASSHFLKSYESTDAMLSIDAVSRWCNWLESNVHIAAERQCGSLTLSTRSVSFQIAYCKRCFAQELDYYCR